MFTTAITATLTAALTLAATPAPLSTAEVDISDIEVAAGAESMHVSTFDGDGDQSGEVEIWTDGAHNPVRIEANFADGLHLSARVVDGKLELESPDPGEAVRRMATIGNIATDIAAVVPPNATASEAGCYMGLIGASSCITGVIVGCMLASFVIACNCLPLVNDTPTPGCE